MAINAVKTLNALWAWSVSQYGDHVFWVRRNLDAGDAARNLYFAQVNKYVAYQASQLVDVSVAPGDRVGICLANGPEWAIAAFAVWQVGGVVVPLHTNNTPEEMQEQLDALALKCVIAPEVESSSFPMPVLSVDLTSCDVSGDVSGDVQSSALPVVDRSEDDLSEDDLAALFYTSGSTGQAKIVQLTHRNLVSNLKSCHAALPEVNASDCFIALLPFSHAMGLTAQLLVSVALGSRLVAPRKLVAKEVIDCLVEEKVSVMIAVPQLFRNMMLTMEKTFAASPLLSAYVWAIRAAPLWLRLKLNKPLVKKFGPIKIWVSGGSRLDPEITRYFHNLGIPLRQGYGLTETSPVVSITGHFDPVHDSVGMPIPGVEVRLEPAQGHEGQELWIRGENVMLGYTDPKLTADIMVDDWMRTGDIAEIDAKGRIAITGRSKRLIVTATGKNVFPEDLEVHLEQEPWVKEACVVEYNQHPAAVVVMDEAVTNPQRILEDTLRNFNQKVAPHKKIHHHVLSDALPRTPLGKVALVEVQKYLLENIN